FDQTQPPQFPVIHPPPQETSIENLHDQENAINSVQTLLRKFNRYSFFETPKVLLLFWDRVFEIKDAFGNKQYKPEDMQELFRKLFNDVHNIHEELAEYINTPATKSNEVTKSSVKDLVPIPSESEGFDQTQPPQFPVIHPPPQETSIENLHDQENAINSVQTLLRKFNRYSFFETPKVLLLFWDRVFEIKDAFGNKQYKPEDMQELFRKLFNDVHNIHEELAEYINTPG
nr:hypothetical protein [Tanacetum cinerariifolium]